MDAEDVTYSVEAEFDHGHSMTNVITFLEAFDDAAEFDRLELAISSPEPIHGVEESASASVEAPDESETDEAGTAASVREGSDAHAVLSLLGSDDRWLLTEDLRDDLTDDVNQETLSSTLYDIVERGLAEKRAAEADGRKREYRVTAAGQRALDGA